MPSIHPGSNRAARAVWTVACCGMLILSGCKGKGGPDLGPMAPVKGRVVFNGAHVVDGRVTYIPTEEKANVMWPEGLIDANGFYTLKTNGMEGAPLGKYRAIVVPGADSKKVTVMMDPLFGNRTQSPLQIEVVENKPEGGYDLPLQPRQP